VSPGQPAGGEPEQPGELEQLARLVALDTVSPLDEPRLRRAERLLAGYGCERLPGGLFGRGEQGSPLWIYCHLDTKPPVPRAEWATEPHRLVRAGERLYGLGVSDAKFQLLNVLLGAPADGCFVLIDTAEECGGRDAASLIAGSEIDTLLVADGAAGRHELYDGLSGQIDGVLRLRTHRPRLHPGRERTGADARRPELLELICALRERLAGEPFRFHLTGLAAPPSERSLTLEEARLRFDLRFDAGGRAAARAFLAAHDHEIRQWMEPLAGRERFSSSGLAVGPSAPFASNLGGGGDERAPRRVVVVPGARNDNGAHRPNEHIERAQIGLHRERLRVVIAAIQGEGRRRGRAVPPDGRGAARSRRAEPARTRGVGRADG
jgi:acetylornithine deacetylase/succinyl-diaminopimelate desuccinylase-like protein